MSNLLLKNKKRFLIYAGLIIPMVLVKVANAKENGDGANATLGKTETKLILEGKPANDVTLPPEPAVTQYKWTLKDVRQIAENQNPDLKAAKANFEAAEKMASAKANEETAVASPSGVGETALLAIAAAAVRVMVLPGLLARL